MMEDMPAELRVFINAIALLLSGPAGMFITLYSASLLYRITNPELVAKGLPFLYMTALGGFLLGLLTGISFVFRNVVMALRGGAALTILFLLLFFTDGCSDSHWVLSLDRTLPLVAWAVCLIAAGRMAAKRRCEAVSEP